MLSFGDEIRVTIWTRQPGKIVLLFFDRQLPQGSFICMVRSRGIGHAFWGALIQRTRRSVQYSCGTRRQRPKYSLEPGPRPDQIQDSLLYKIIADVRVRTPWPLCPFVFSLFCQPIITSKSLVMHIFVMCVCVHVHVCKCVHIFSCLCVLHVCVCVCKCDECVHL